MRWVTLLKTLPRKKFQTKWKLTKINWDPQLSIPLQQLNQNFEKIVLVAITPLTQFCVILIDNRKIAETVDEFQNISRKFFLKLSWYTTMTIYLWNIAKLQNWNYSRSPFCSRVHVSVRSYWNYNSWIVYSHSNTLKVPILIQENRIKTTVLTKMTTKNSIKKLLFQAVALTRVQDIMHNGDKFFIDILHAHN